MHMMVQMNDRLSIQLVHTIHRASPHHTSLRYFIMSQQPVTAAPIVYYLDATLRLTVLV